MNEQIKYQDRVGNITKDIDGFYNVHSPRGTEKVSKNSCKCSFYSSMHLPCRHIFAVRTVEKEDLFSESLCDFRWTNKFYKSHHWGFLHGPTLDEEERLIHTVEKGKILSKAQKFRQASTVCTRPAQLPAEVGYGEYLRRLETLEIIMWHWENGHETCVKEVSKGKVFNASSLPVNWHVVVNMKPSWNLRWKVNVIFVKNDLIILFIQKKH